MAFRNDLDALHARHDSLETDVNRQQRELAETRRLIAELEARKRLPVLPNLRVAAPCTADWNAMTGDARVRACAQCNKHVYNLSEMTRDEAEALILAKEGRLCVRYYKRLDGTILLKDCTVGVKQRRRRRIVAGAAAMLAATGAFGAVRSLQKVRAEIEHVDETEVMMGDIAMPEMGQMAVPVNPPEELQAIQGGVDPEPPPIAKITE